MTITTCIFDAYGTLFDVAAAAREAAAEPDFATLAEHWEGLAKDWRDKQLAYTWLFAAAGRHRDFERLTEEALDWALASRGLNDRALRARLLALYRELSAYPEVPTMLAALKAKGLATGILSNGTPGMLSAAIAAAGIGGSLDAVLSVEDVGVFKPSPRVYDMVGERFGCAPSEVLFASSNGWDAAAAAGYGFRSVWVNRAGAPHDPLWAAPSDELRDLSPLPDLI